MLLAHTSRNTSYWRHLRWDSKATNRCSLRRGLSRFQPLHPSYTPLMPTASPIFLYLHVALRFRELTSSCDMSARSFVRFSASIEAQSAIQGMDGHRVGAKRLLCKLANSPKEKGSIPVSPGKASADEPIKNSARHASSPSLASPSSSGSASSSPRASPPNPPRSNSAPIHPHALTAAILQSKQPSTNLYIKSLLPDDNEGAQQNPPGRPDPVPCDASPLFPNMTNEH